MISRCAKIAREEPFRHVGGVVDAYLVDPVASPETGVATAGGPCMADIEHFEEGHALLSIRGRAQSLLGLPVGNTMGATERAGLKELGRYLGIIFGPLHWNDSRGALQDRWHGALAAPVLVQIPIGHRGDLAAECPRLHAGQI